MERTIVCSILVAASMSRLASGQVASAPSKFEVASVKPSKPGIRGGSMDFPKGGERFTATNMALGPIILTAYNITVRQLSAPASFPVERYDIAAKAEYPVSPDQMLRMLQALLVERFKLVTHRETKEVPIYALAIAKGGPKLQPSDPSGTEGATPRTPARAGGTEPASGHLIFRNESMSDFAWALSRTAGIGDRLVVDDTDLKGNYDFELTFGRDSAPAADASEPVTLPQAPSIFSALQDQLGLKLESKKAPVEFLIVDHVEKPSEN